MLKPKPGGIAARATAATEDGRQLTPVELDTWRDSRAGDPRCKICDRE